MVCEFRLGQFNVIVARQLLAHDALELPALHRVFFEIRLAQFLLSLAFATVEVFETVDPGDCPLVGDLRT